MYELFIANKNYTTWGLRPWLLLSHLDIAFHERFMRFTDGSSWDAFRAFSPTGKVPALRDGDAIVWDSLAITEYVAERHPRVWPADPLARAWARCASAEMHSGFAALRTHCTNSCGVRIRLDATPPALVAELARLSELWHEGLARFGGPFLAGSAFTAVDAFYAPVAFRAQTYSLPFDDVSAAYLARLRALPAMTRWYEAALAEPWREPAHEAETLAAGTLIEDLRAYEPNVSSG